MKIALRSHLDSHPEERHNVGAGIVRVTCTLCHHVSIEEAPPSIRPAPRIPVWMEQAATRFADLETERIVAVA